MNEAETRAELIDPALKAAGWGVVEASRVRREVITLGRLQGAGVRAAQDIADYVLTYRNHKLAVIEAKRRDLPDTEGLGQAKKYAGKLQTRFAYSTNGAGISGRCSIASHETCTETLDRLVRRAGGSRGSGMPNQAAKDGASVLVARPDICTRRTAESREGPRRGARLRGATTNRPWPAWFPLHRQRGSHFIARAAPLHRHGRRRRL
jgi:hypothetical protein